MKKLFLQINGFTFFIFLLTCSKPQKEEAHVNPDPLGVYVDVSDSLLKNVQILDTANPIKIPSPMCSPKTTKPDSIISPSTQLEKKDSVVVHKRIEHGSDNPTKLDSIKKAKGKGKN
ncbi:MAG: hypothetical protein ABJC12_14020 [Saprospiraceae bacterium]